MENREFRILGSILILIGILISLNNLSEITGLIIAGNIKNSSIYFLGIGLIVGGILILALNRNSAKSDLELKLGKIKNVRVMRELVSDAHRAEKFAERGIDVNGLWDPKKSYEENENSFFREFYDDVDNEITSGYWKATLRKDVDFNDFKENINNYTNNEDFKIYKEKALKSIIYWNDKIISGE